MIKKLVLLALVLINLFLITLLFPKLHTNKNYTGNNFKTNNFKIKVGQEVREYLVFVPKGLEKNPAVVIVLHGGGGPLGTAEMMLQRSGWAEKANKEKFLAVFPQGTIEDPASPVNVDGELKNQKRNIRDWNEFSKRTSSSIKNIDDVGFISQMIDDLEKKYQIDKNKVFATGFSNGATMSFVLGIKLSNKIAAIAPIAGAIFLNDKPTEPVSLLSIVGSSDSLPATNFLHLVKKTYAASPINNPVTAWSKYIGCKKEEKKDEKESFSVDIYSSCDGGTEVISYIIGGLGHVYPGRAELFQEDPEIGNKLNATDTSWEFFESHPKIKK